MFSPHYKISLFLLRVSMGLLCIYYGYMHIIEKAWTAAPYIEQTKYLTQFYHLMLNNNVTPWIDMLNSWGLIVTGVLLVIGLSNRFISMLMFFVMILYYIPILRGIYTVRGVIIFDPLLLYACLFLFLVVSNAGEFYGVGKKLTVRLS